MASPRKLIWLAVAVVLVVAAGLTVAGHHAVAAADQTIVRATGRPLRSFVRRIQLWAPGNTVHSVQPMSWLVTYWIPDSTVEYEQAQVVLTFTGAVERTFPARLEGWLYRSGR
jgi:hypothetical protein